MNFPAVDVSSYNRFLLTSGIAMLAISLLYPWLLLDASTDQLLTQAERAALSAPSLEALERKEQLVETAFKGIPIIPAVTTVLGLVLLGVGALGARESQALDQREQMARIEGLLRKPSPPEKESKFEAEVSDAMQDRVDGIISEPGLVEQVEQPSLEAMRSEIAQSYASIETVVLDILEQAFPVEKVHLGVGVESDSGTLFADALVQRNRLPDLVVEVKLLTTPNSTRARESARQLLTFVQTYERRVGRRSRGLLLYVLTPGLGPSSVRDALEDRLSTRSFDGWEPTAREKIKLLVFSKDELESLDADEFARRLES